MIVLLKYVGMMKLLDVYHCTGNSVTFDAINCDFFHNCSNIPELTFILC